MGEICLFFFTQCLFRLLSSSPVDQSPPIFGSQEQLINQQIEEKRAKLRSYFDVGARRCWLGRSMGDGCAAVRPETDAVLQGLVTVPFWEYWTSPYSSHYRPYT